MIKVKWKSKGCLPQIPPTSDIINETKLQGNRALSSKAAHNEGVFNQQCRKFDSSIITLKICHFISFCSVCNKSHHAQYVTMAALNPVLSFLPNFLLISNCEVLRNKLDTIVHWVPCKTPYHFANIYMECQDVEKAAQTSTSLPSICINKIEPKQVRWKQKQNHTPRKN